MIVETFQEVSLNFEFKTPKTDNFCQYIFAQN
jgi:hypothetical protein